MVKISKGPKRSITLPVTIPAKGAAGSTGTWRIHRPVLNKDKKCSGCLLCWVYCPEGCIEVSENGTVGIDLEYCKGCGICSKECRLGVIVMEREEM